MQEHAADVTTILQLGFGRRSSCIRTSARLCSCRVPEATPEIYNLSHSRHERLTNTRGPPRAQHCNTVELIRHTFSRCLGARGLGRIRTSTTNISADRTLLTLLAVCHCQPLYRHLTW